MKSSKEKEKRCRNEWCYKVLSEEDAFVGLDGHSYCSSACYDYEWDRLNGIGDDNHWDFEEEEGY